LPASTYQRAISAEFPVTVPITFGLEGLSCGYDFGEAVTREYQAPYRFTGTVKQVTVDLSGELHRGR
jgi:arylsulfatase